MEKKKESRSGMEIMNLLQVFVVGRINRTERISSPFFLVMIFMMCMYRKKGGSVGLGMGRRLIMIFIRKLYAGSMNHLDFVLDVENMIDKMLFAGGCL